jgi:capsular polysaccharide biosynthesis protein
VKLSLDDRDHPRERLWAYADFESPDAGSASDLGAGLVTLAFLRAALRRKAKVWVSLAIIGLLGGLAVLYVRPVPYQASASVLLPPSAYIGQIADDQAMVQTRTVAELALHKLGLHLSATTFVGEYTSTAAGSSTRVLVITASAKSSAEAVREANALAWAFLSFQTKTLNVETQLVNASLQQQITQTEQDLDSITVQAKQLSAQPASPARNAEIARLRVTRTQEINTLGALKGSVVANQATTQIATTTTLAGSRVLDSAAPIARHIAKVMLLYGAAGLLAGLVLGLAIVVLGALMSTRLRQRDDIARALGAPVRLSVGNVRSSRSKSGHPDLANAQSPEVKRIAAYLGSALPSSSRRPASLAVVLVDDVNVPALSLVSLALSCAQQGMKVLVVDLCSDRPAARLLGPVRPGLQTVSVAGVSLVVEVPESHELVPFGPLGPGSRWKEAPQDLVSACADADLMLTLAAVEPSTGGEYLATWATHAVVVTTAGRSSATRIRAVGEMLRLAQLEFSAVLVGADKTDESLGISQQRRVGGDRNVSPNGLYPEEPDLLVTFDRTSGKTPSGER